VFLSVTISHILKNKNYELCFLAGSFFDQITTRKRYSHLAVDWNVWGFHQLRLFWWVPQSNYNQKQKVQLSGHWFAMSDCFGGFVTMFFGGFLDQITNYNQKKGTVVWLAYTICNTCNILFFLCLYLKQENKLNVGIIWFKGKASSRTSKTCLTMVEPFAGPSSMAMCNQPMPSRYPLCKRLSRAGCEVFC
jgi:hypothetical protein